MEERRRLRGNSSVMGSGAMIRPGRTITENNLLIRTGKKTLQPICTVYLSTWWIVNTLVIV